MPLTRLRGPAAVAAGTAVLWIVLGRGYLGYDTEWSLIWGGDIAGGGLPDHYGATTPHPLANALGALVSPLGDAAPTILLVTYMAAFATVAYQLFQVGRTLIAWPVGAVAAALVLTRAELVELTLHASFEVLFLALVTTAAVAEARRPRRGEAVLVLLAAAGLLRPEAWLLAAAYTVYLLAATERRRWPRLIALGAAAPVVWVLSDVIVTADPLHSRHATPPFETRPGARVAGGVDVPSAPWDFLRDALTGPVALCGAAGLVAGLCLLRRRVALPATIFALGMSAFLALYALDLPRVVRFVMLPATMLVLFCGVATFGWLGIESRSLLRRVWTVAAIAVLAVLIVVAPADLRRVDRVAENSRRVGDSVRDLDRLAERPLVRAASGRCPKIYIQKYGYRPQVALAFDRDPEEILVGGSPASARGLAVLTADTPRPPGFTPVAASRQWTVTERRCR